MPTEKRRVYRKASAAQRARYAKRRAGRMRRADNDLTAQEWSAVLDAWGGVCAYCGAAGGQLQKDCVQPLSRGGRYTRDNVVPACRSCNASKHNNEVTGWMRRKGFDEQTFLLRLRQIIDASVEYQLAPSHPGHAERDVSPHSTENG